MPFSDEFDLDLVTSGNGIPGGNQPQSTSAEVSWAVSSLIIGSVLTGCTGDCVSSACSDNCSDNCTSANSCGCHVKVKQLGTKTEQGKYSSKYALTDLLICGECGTPYRRCTWTNNGKKKVVWRCISRLDYGKKHCHNSPSVEESILQEAIMDAIMRTAKQNADVLRTLKLHIGMGLAATDVEDNSLDIQIRIAEIDAEFKAMLQAVETYTMDASDEEKAGRLMNEKAELQKQLDRISETKQKRENTKSRLEEIFTILEGLNNHPMTYDDKIVRQIIECVVVESKERIKVVFVGGTEVSEPLG